VTRILAIHEDTNANAALIEDGAIVAAVAEERLTRRKFQPGHPARAVDAVLASAGIALDEVDAVVAGNRYHFLPRLLGEAPLLGEHDLFGARHRSWTAMQARLRHGGPLARRVERVSAAALRRRFGRSVPLVDHHTAHAYSAWLTSGFDEALAVSIDNLGDGWSARTFRCGGGRAEPLWGSSAEHSPGQFYGEITQLLGFHLMHAGKVTGLAARGDARAAYPFMERLFGLCNDDTEFRLASSRLRSRRRGPYRELRQFTREQIAAAAQQRLEHVILRHVQRGLDETGLRHVVLAGGVFANVLLNQRLWHLPAVDGLFVHPAMTDQGIAAGAALAHLAATSGLRPQPMEHAYLGPGYDDEAIAAALDEADLPHERCVDIEARVAELVAGQQVVARFSGRMEYGPRALGHRSILVHTGDPAVNDWLNRRLGRSEFMPFAPATLAEHAAACYEDYGPGVAHAARFMTLTFRCSESMKKASPAVVHVDGTARPQVVHADASPGLHRILSLVHEHTGVPSVINTSLNVHGEPIVCSPADAIQMIRARRVHALAIGPFLVRA
jgi:carbamoyltransferase